MASKRRNMFHKNETQETTEKGSGMAFRQAVQRISTYADRTWWPKEDPYLLANERLLRMEPINRCRWMVAVQMPDRRRSQTDGKDQAPLRRWDMARTNSHHVPEDNVERGTWNNPTEQNTNNDSATVPAEDGRLQGARRLAEDGQYILTSGGGALPVYDHGSGPMDMKGFPELPNAQTGKRQTDGATVGYDQGAEATYMETFPELPNSHMDENRLDEFQAFLASAYPKRHEQFAIIRQFCQRLDDMSREAVGQATPAEHAQTNPATSRRLYRDVVASKESAGARMVEGQEHAVNGGQQQPWEDQEAVYARLEKEALEQYTSRETDHAVGELEESAGAGMAEGQEHAVNGGHQPPWEDPEDVYARMENEALEQYIPWETEHPAGEQHLEERAGDKRVEGQEHEVTGGHRQPWEDPEAVYARMEKEALEQYTPSKTDLPDGELEESAGVRRAEGEERATTRGQQQQWEDPEAVYTRMEKEALEQYIPWGTELPAGGLQLEATDRKPRVAQEVRGTSPPAGVSEDATRSGEDSGTPTVRAPVSPKTPVDSHIGGTARTNPWRTGGASSRADDGRPTVGRQPDKKPPRGRKKKTIERRGKGPTVPAQPISSLHFKESDAKPIAVRLKWTMLNYLKEVDWRGGSCGGGGGPQSGAGRTAAHPGVAAYKSVVSQLLYGPVVLSPLMVTRVRISDISDSDTLRAYLKELVHTMKVDLSETYRRVRGEAVDATSRGQVVTVKPTTREKRRVRQMIKRLVALEGRLDRLERPIKFQVEQLRKDIREALNLIHTTMDVVYTLKDMTESASNELDYYRNVKRVLVDAILGASTLCDLKPHFLNRIMDEFGPLILRHMPKAAAESKDVHSWNKHPTSEDQRVVPKAKPAPERTARSVAAAVTAANTRSTSCAVESAKTSSMSGWMLPPFEELPREDRTVLIFCLAERAIKL